MVLRILSYFSSHKCLFICLHHMVLLIKKLKVAIFIQLNYLFLLFLFALKNMKRCTGRFFKLYNALASYFLYSLKYFYNKK